MFFGLICMLIGVAIGWHERGRRRVELPPGSTHLKFENGAFVRFDKDGVPLSVQSPADICEHPGIAMAARCTCGRAHLLHHTGEPACARFVPEGN